MEIGKLISTLLHLCEACGLLKKRDATYCANRISALLKLDEFEFAPIIEDIDVPDILDKMAEYAAKNEIIPDLFDVKESFCADIMNVFLALPSEIDGIFSLLCDESPRKATEYFYDLSKKSNYIQLKRIAKNISFDVPTEYGDLVVTINLSKPEKNPNDIAAALKVKSSAYPKCMLCVENEGYEGRISYPARANHRIVKINLSNEDWYFQYSPYSYYNEHCIVLSSKHRDMVVNRDALARLLEFVAKFPHYMAGSNADLPIVGGSILTHDHYQGGNYEFPMAKAAVDYDFALPAFADVEFSVMKWPMSLIRAKSGDSAALADAADYILTSWRAYSDTEAEILAFSEGNPHNTITPIVRMRDGQYEVDLILRNNRQSAEHPMGIFHPHADVHHIKKENIGLIEAMGLAILPGRLVSELGEIKRFLLNENSNVADYHIPWANELSAKYSGTVTNANIDKIIELEIGKKFERVLYDAGVFKRDENGKTAFLRFVKSL